MDIDFYISYIDMGFFSFFKKRNIETATADHIALTPVAILQSLQDYIPELYKDRRPFADYREFLQHHEFGLALDSLIQLADESGHYFSEHFWLNLASCADKMGMSAEAKHSRQQIRRNKRDNVLVAKGHTIERTDRNELVQHVSVAASK
jgi:hypothetical protein